MVISGFQKTQRRSFMLHNMHEATGRIITILPVLQVNKIHHKDDNKTPRGE